MEERFMQLAIDLAKENVKSQKGGPFGAVIVKEGDIISMASNSVTATHDPTAHAEINAIRKACLELNTIDLSGCHIYTSCEPCPMCLGAIYWAKISKIYYACSRQDAENAGFNDKWIYKELGLELSRRSIPSFALLKDKGLEALKLWNDSPMKIPY